MGDLMRCYWIPAADVVQLVRDGAPVRRMLLGEKLIAFRDSAGRVGVMDHRCPHRCASLFSGATRRGVCAASITAGSSTWPAMRGHAEPAAARLQGKSEGQGLQGRGARRRRLGLHGRTAEAPPLPAFEILDIPEDEVRVGFIQRDCNYLQALEGEIDTSHFGFLHAGHVDPDDLAEDEPVLQHRDQPRAGIHLARHRMGHAVRGLPRSGPGQTYWRFGNFLFPFWTRRRTASSARTCMRAAGCRSTTSTPGLPVVEEGGARGFPATARLQGWFAHRRHRGAATSCCRTRPTGSADGAWRRTRATTGRSTARRSKATGSTAGSTASTCRTRRSPRAWAELSTTSSSTSRRRTR